MIRLFAVCMLLVGTLPATAQDTSSHTHKVNTIEMVGLRVPWVLDPERPGPYNKVADALFEGYSTPVHLELQPLMRAIRHFFEGDAECFFMGDTDEAYFEGTSVGITEILVSEPFNVARIRAFTFRKPSPISTLDDLQNLRVAVDLGIGGMVRIMNVVPGMTNLVDAVNAEQVHAMLTKGRAEAALMMDYDYELYAARHPNQERLQFDPALSIQRADDGIMCKKSDKTEAFIEHVNARITELRASGELQAILRAVQ